MWEGHPDATTLEKFRLAKLSVEEAKPVVRHLLAGCAACSQRFQTVPSAADGNGSLAPRVDFQALEDLAAAMDQEHREALELYSELSQYPPAQQRALVANDPRFQTLGLVELLFQKCCASGFRDAAKAVSMAELALSILQVLDERFYGCQMIADYMARGFSCLANAQRVANNFRAAEKSFRRAIEYLRQGTGDALEEAIILHHYASLRGEQQKYNEAFNLFDKAIAVYKNLKEQHKYGKALIDKGLYLGYSGDYLAAIKHLEEGLEIVDRRKDLRHLLAAEHNLALFLAESGRYAETQRRLENIKEIYIQVYHEVGDEMSVVRRRWLEGKIAQGLGKIGEAEKALQEVRDEFVTRGLAFDGALASLELAAVYVQQGRSGEVCRLAAEMVPIFQSRDIHREAMAALLFFRQAAEREEATFDLIQEVLGFLKKAQHNPELRFKAPA